MWPPTIRLEGFCLRAWQANDAQARSRHGSDPEISRYMFQWFGYPHTVEAAQKFINDALDNDRDILYCISHQGEAIGSISLNLCNDSERFGAEIGYWLGREYWGRGIMSRALIAVVDAAINQHGLHRIYATVEPDNQASAKVLIAAGFKLEGRLKHAVFRDGRFIDHLVYGYAAKGPGPDSPQPA
jgi:ribosomal-protein-alanine N-acetyltransferase